ncbi:MAG: GNAT family N-acetyltransferase [Parabacteroides sp.]|nr:GNAT family N-acetyltransferase [Parabacteroides sp.]
MIKIITIAEYELWDKTVKGFLEYDVYYLSGYVKAFLIHGDGEPQLLYYDYNGLKAIYVYMKRNTSIEGLYDSITPYGYGGVLFEGEKSIDNLRAFWDAYVDKMNELNIVDNFVRYHPVLANAIPMKEISEVIDLGKTVAIDLTSSEIIWENIASKNRNMIRKAEKNGIEIHHAHDYSLFSDFIRIYNGTMDKDHAEEYYYFKEDFYKSIHHDLKGHYEMFYAVYEGQIIAMSIILFANKQMHYHLSGSLIEYRNLAPSNLLLYKVALWGYEQGYKTFHLGGGVGSGEDNLYKFKAAFNRKSDYQFSIAKHIFNRIEYDRLVEERENKDKSFDKESKFFPLYRS